MPFTRSTFTADAGHTMLSSECAKCGFRASAPATQRGRTALAIAEVAHSIAAVSSCPDAAERRKVAPHSRRAPYLMLSIA